MKLGWEIKTWQDVLEVRSGRNQKAVLNPEGKYPIIGSAGKVMNYADDFLCEEGTTIIGRKGTIDKPQLIHTKFWNVDTAFGLVAGEQLDKRFLFYFCLNFDFQTLNKGTTLPSLVKKDLVKIQIPIPPLQEQKQIVAILDKAFVAIDQAQANIQQNIQNAQDLLTTSLEHVYKGLVRQNGNRSLNDICELIVDCEHKTAPTQETGYPSIRTPNIGKGHIILEDVKRVSEEIYLLWSKRAFPEPGDLIMAREAPAGNVAVIPHNLKVCLGQRTLLIRPKKQISSSSFLAYYLLTASMQKTLLSKSAGATVSHINMKDIRNLPVGEFPKLKIQLRAEETVSSIFQKSSLLNQLLQKRLNSLEELKKSLLQKAFTGELTKNKQAA